MTGYSICDHFIPLHKSELVDAVCADPAVPLASQEPLRQLCRLIGALCHVEYQQLLEKLKTAYAPFDPDADTLPLGHWTASQKQQKLNALFTEFTSLMEKADFKHLSVDEIEPALQQASDSGMRMDVDFRVFERLGMFVRGEMCVTRTRRRARHRWRREEVLVPAYRRLVMMFKLRPHKRLGSRADSESVYFQLFKNIPKRNIAMLLPGARARINPLDRGKISFSLLGGLALTFWRILQDISQNVVELFLFQHPAALWGLATGTVGYGAKTYLGYQQTRQRYHLTLTEILYYQNLDTNTGVLYRVLDEAEEQQCRELILSYYFLWRYGGDAGWTPKQLEEAVEKDLHRRAQVGIHFDVAGALARLEKLKLVEKIGDCFCALPLPRALDMLQGVWGSCFRTHAFGQQVGSWVDGPVNGPHVV